MEEKPNILVDTSPLHKIDEAVLQTAQAHTTRSRDGGDNKLDTNRIQQSNVENGDIQSDVPLSGNSVPLEGSQ